MKTIIIILSLVFAALSFAAEKEPDPFIGSWRVISKNGKNLSVWEVRADGSLTNGPDFAVWKATETKNVEKKYSVSWNGGRIPAQVTMDRSGKKFRARVGEEDFTGTKIE